MTQPPPPYPGQPDPHAEDDNTRIRPTGTPRHHDAPPTPQPAEGAPAGPPPGQWQQPQEPAAPQWQPSQQPAAPQWQPPQQPAAPRWQPPQQPAAPQWRAPQEQQPYGAPPAGRHAGPGPGHPSGTPSGATTDPQGSAIPQWQPPQGALPQQPQTPAAPKKRGLLYAGLGALVLVLLVAAAGLFFFTGKQGVTVADLSRGDCLASPALADGSSDVKDVKVVSCDDSHDAQVVATGELDGSTEAADACVQQITDVATSVAALSVDGHEVKPLSSDDSVACLVVGKDLKGSVVN